MENQLERYVQGLKSLGKVTWIALGLTAITGISSDIVKDKKAELYLSGASFISTIVALGGMIKNGEKIIDCLNPYITNEELKKIYGLTGDNYIFPIK